MPGGQTRVSAFISDGTKEALERYAEAYGLKKAYLIEEALVHHLQALRELPLDVIIPARLVVSPRSGLAVKNRASKPRRPTKAMRALFGKQLSDQTEPTPMFLEIGAIPATGGAPPK